MPTSTTFLNLTLPELNEFVDSWHTVVNGNMETLDDFLDDLFSLFYLFVAEWLADLTAVTVDCDCFEAETP